MTAIEIKTTNVQAVQVGNVPNPPGPAGPTGPAGPGVPAGGTTGQVLAKASNTDDDTHWIDPSGGGGGAVDSVDGVTGAVDLTSSYQQIAAVQTINVTGDSPVTVAVKRAYTANLSGGNIVYNLPAAPANNSRVMFSVSAVSGSNTATVNTGGSDKFTTPTTGPTSKVLNKVGQTLVLQYHAASAIWIVQADVIRSATAGYGTTPNTATQGELKIDVQADVQEFGGFNLGVPLTVTGTWTKPSWATATSKVRIELVSGGGGGGSGRRGAAGTVRGGGGGGQAGIRSWCEYVAGDLPATVSVQAGAGGTGGTAIAADDTNGNAGGQGVASFFGKYVYASGGGGGGAGTTAGGAGGTTVATSRGTVPGSPGIAGSDTATPAQPDSGRFTAGQLTANWLNGGGGGGGAGIDASNANKVGTNGQPVNGYQDGTTTGGAAGAGALGGATGTSGTFQASGGGGGGRANGANAVGGGDGGFPGGGGGGGGAALNTFTAGNGGDGGNGFVRITTWP